MHTFGGRMVKESLSSESWGSPNIKVLAVTFSLPPSISLYSSQYKKKKKKKKTSCGK